MDPFVSNMKEYLNIEQWMMECPDLVVGFTTKNGGTSHSEFSSLNFGFHVGDSEEAVRQNKMKLSDLIQISTKNWVAAEQTHGIHIKKITKEDCGKGSFRYKDSISDTDGFYTTEKGVLLTLCYADCVPIFFLDKTTKTIGVAHAGWKGTVNGIAKEMVEAWERSGINPANILVAIGPSICKKCYMVDDFVIDFVQKVLEDVEKKPYNQIIEGQYQLDLKQLNKFLLVQSGIIESNISITDYCSSCNTTEFFSHRRDKGSTGRMMSFIGWKEDSQS